MKTKLKNVSERVFTFENGDAELIVPPGETLQVEQVNDYHIALIAQGMLEDVTVKNEKQK